MTNESVAPLSFTTALAQQGWAISDDLFTPAFWDTLDRCSQSPTLVSAGTGRGADFQRHSVRGDRIHWLLPEVKNEAVVLDALDEVRTHLNQQLLLNVHEVEAHLACYPPGHRYARHLDSFRHGNTRVVSLLCYLNKDWQAHEGGQLRLHLPEGPMDVTPERGRCVAFVSEDIEHEVLAGTRERWSLAAWFRRRPASALASAGAVG